MQGLGVPTRNYFGKVQKGQRQQEGKFSKGRGVRRGAREALDLLGEYLGVSTVLLVLPMLDNFLSFLVRVQMK